jgi:sporulation protein YlmC with PRC-barrel domain
MRNKLNLQLFTAAAISVLGVTSFAQDSNTAAAASSGKSSASATQASGMQQAQGRDMRASKLIGKDVKNAQGEDLGEIEDLVIDPVSQRVHYAVLSFGGLLGLGDKMFAFPVSAFKPSRNRDELVLNVDKDRLKDAPGFERDAWPNWSDNRYRDEVDRYFKANAVGGVAPGERMMRASDLIGMEVDDPKGEDVGEIEDLVVNMANGRIRYVVLDFDKEWSLDDKLVTLPLTSFTFPQEGRELVLSTPKERIDMSRGFDENSWPDFNNRRFRRENDRYLSGLDAERNTTRAQGNQAGQTTSSGASGTRN